MKVYASKVLLSSIECKFKHPNCKESPKGSTMLSPKTDTRCIICAVTPRSLNRASSKQRYKEKVHEMTSEQKRRYKIIAERLFEIELQNEYDKKIANDEIDGMLKLEEYHLRQKERRFTKLEELAKKEKKQDFTHIKKEANLECIEQVKLTLEQKLLRERLIKDRENKISSEREQEKLSIQEIKKKKELAFHSKRNLLTQSEKVFSIRRKQLKKQTSERVQQIKEEFQKERERHLQLKKKNEEEIRKRKEKITKKLLLQEEHTQSVMKMQGRQPPPPIFQ